MDSTTYLALASPHLMLVGNRLSINDTVSVLSLDCAVEFAVDGILEHVDCIVKVSERVTDGDYIQVVRVKSSPGDQAPKTAKFIYSDLHHRVLGT